MAQVNATLCSNQFKNLWGIVFSPYIDLVAGQMAGQM
jgi:hypothetical protein